MRDDNTSPHIRSASSRGGILALLATPHLRRAAMTKSPTSIPALPHRFLPPDDASLFAFVGTLQLAVRARVRDEQRRGVSFAAIVIQVRDMLRAGEEADGHSDARVSPMVGAISRQALKWCLEAYRPAPGQQESARDRFPTDTPT